MSKKVERFKELIFAFFFYLVLYMLFNMLNMIFREHIINLIRGLIYICIKPSLEVKLTSIGIIVLIIICSYIYKKPYEVSHER